MRWLWLAVAGAILAAEPAAGAPPELVIPPPIEIPALPAGQTAASVKFARAAFQLPDGSVWGYEGAGLTCRIAMTPMRWKASDWALDTPRLASIFREEITQAGFSRAQNASLFDQGPSPDRYQVAALITGVDSRFCAWREDDGSVEFAGRMLLTIEWQLYDNLRGEVVKRIEAKAGIVDRKYSRDGVERVFYGAFRSGVRALLATGEFRATLTAELPETRQAALEPMAYTPAKPDRRMIGDAANAVAAIFTGDGHGTGFLVSSEGYLLTNQHVVGDAKYVKVRWFDGVETVGEVIRKDRRRDTALVKADRGSRAPLALKAARPALGEAVYAIGTPLDAKFQGTVTKGIVSATRTYEGLPYIQSDVVINNGNSGGPLLDEAGAVIGICVSGMDINGAPVGINLFIPIDEALKALALTPAA